MTNATNATGKRKRAVCRAWVCAGSGQFTVNDCSLESYFPRATHRSTVIYPIEKTDPEWKSIPYGKPLSNQLTYVMDRHMQLLPVGVPGELYLGGIGIAWGYFDRPELTAEKFVPNPFSDEPGDRLYKTGDLTRYYDDGNLELLGRIDFQIKIRGFRIELGEIAAALRQHPSVREAVVTARGDNPSNKRLVAYVLPERNSAAGQISFTEDNDRRRFIDDASHQLRTPLTTLATQLGFALRENDPAQLPLVLEAGKRRLEEALALSAGAVGESYRGGRLGQQTFILDGLGVKNRLDASTGPLGVRLPPDILTEASLVTNGFSARYGQALSGMVNAVTREPGRRWQGRWAYENDRPFGAGWDYGLDRVAVAADGPVVGGIGFLGAGCILQSGERVRGLTTAGSIWVTAAIGILSPAGAFQGWLQRFRGFYLAHPYTAAAIVGLYEIRQPELFQNPFCLCRTIVKKVQGSGHVQVFDAIDDCLGISLVHGNGRSLCIACGIRYTHHIKIPRKLAVFSGRAVDDIEDAVKPYFLAFDGDGKIIEVDGVFFPIRAFIVPVVGIDIDLVHLVQFPVQVLLHHGRPRRPGVAQGRRDGVQVHAEALHHLHEGEAAQLRHAVQALAGGAGGLRHTGQVGRGEEFEREQADRIERVGEVTRGVLFSGTDNPPCDCWTREDTGGHWIVEADRVGHAGFGSTVNVVGGRWFWLQAGNIVRLETRAMATDFAVLMNPGPADQVMSASDALDLLHPLEDQMTAYRAESELSRLNARAATEAVAVEQRLYELLREFVNPVVFRYGFARESDWDHMLAVAERP